MGSTGLGLGGEGQRAQGLRIYKCFRDQGYGQKGAWALGFRVIGASELWDFRLWSKESWVKEFSATGCMDIGLKAGMPGDLHHPCVCA